MSNDELPLRDLVIEGYRGIRHLRLPELGRVNLFVGKNNAGKTSLLEAIRLTLEEDPGVIAALMYDAVREHTDFLPRLRFDPKQADVDPSEIEAAIAAVESLFFGGFNEPPTEAIRAGAIHGDRSVRIYGPRSSPVEAHDLFPNEEDVFFGPMSRLLTVTTRSGSRHIRLRMFVGRVPVRFRHRGDTLQIPAGGLGRHDLLGMWDRLALAGQEGLVEDAVRTIWPSFERALSAGDNGRRSVFVKLDGMSRPVPLQSVGDGVQRVFSIAVALGLATGGALLIDEVENGLHHSAQLEVWDSIFRLAERLNVQVFATTHSWEAVAAFQEAANRSPALGMLYRLEREDDGSVYAERYTEKDVAVAVARQVEVR